MLTSTIYYEGKLIVGRFEEIIQAQSVFDGIFYQVDCHNVGEVKDNFSQLFFDINIEKVEANECDVHRITEFDQGIASHLERRKTAIVFKNEKMVRLGKLYKELTKKSKLEVELFSDLKIAFDWLGYDNPEPSSIKLTSD